MVGKLQEENQQLKMVLRDILSKAEDNHRSLIHLRQLEVQLLLCKNLPELIKTLISGCQHHMSLDSVNLVLYDPEETLAHILEDNPLDASVDEKTFSLTRSHQWFSQIYAKHAKPVLDSINSDKVAAQFEYDRKVQSGALLPLCRHKAIIGSLHLGSYNPRRYRPNMAYDFLEHLATIASVCIENSLNQEKLRYLSQVDGLTRLKNRRSFEVSLSRELARAQRNNKPLSCLFIDLDHFKSINDQYGHDVGDYALRTVAQLVKSQSRETDIISRYGGEEFVALLPETDQQNAMLIAERIRTHVSQATITQHHIKPFKITLSIGATTWEPNPGIHVPHKMNEAILKAADTAVYKAKQSGRDRVKYQPIGPF